MTMISAVLWKEYREHRSVWLALATVAALVLLGVGVGIGFDHGDGLFLRDVLCVVAVGLAWTYGLVCGSILLAGESEEGTQPFLDSLPVTRLQVWRCKLLAGGLFVLAQIAVIATLAAWLRLVDYWVPGVALLLFAGFMGYGWGLLFSAQARTPLAAIGMAVLAQLGPLPAGLLALLFVVALVTWAMGVQAESRMVPWILVVAVSVLLPLPLSVLAYTHDDRTRRLLPQSAASNWAQSWRQPLWLAWRQTRGLALGLAPAALVGGLVVAIRPAYCWPALTLALGVVCGATLFLDEQQGAYRFLGDQRLPLTRWWVAKLLVRLSVLGAALLVAVVPLLIVQSATEARSADSSARHGLLGLRLLQTASPGLFLICWVANAFAIGQLCGLLFRKALVAVVAALGLSLLAMSVWLPSLVLGGLSAWQVLAVPLVLILGARWLLRPWAAGQMALGRLLVLVCACVALTAFGLWYRILGVPDSKVPDGFAAHFESLPELEQNRAGLTARAAIERVDDLRRQWSALPPPPVTFAKEDNTHRTYPDQARRATEQGWPDGDPPLGKWLDDVFGDPMWAKLAGIRDLPAGMVHDPRQPSERDRFNVIDSGRITGTLLAARGLQMQKMSGRPEVFVENLETALALARNLENGGPTLDSLAARNIDHVQLAALEHWLKGKSDPALLRRVEEALRRRRESLPADRLGQKYADYLIAVNRIDTPQEPSDGLITESQTTLEAAMREWAMRVPWERKRLARQVRHLHWAEGATKRVPYELERFRPHIDAGEMAVEPGRAERLEKAIQSVTAR